MGAVLHLMVMHFSRLPTRASAVLAVALVAPALAGAGTMKFSTPCDVPGLREAILQQVNAARERGASCGGQAYGAARTVAWNDQLVSAASGHSRDMADRNYFDHRSLSGTEPGQRVDAVGYKWRGVAENIAAGQFDAQSVVRGWLNSPGHCRNIMDPKFTEIGVACAARAGTVYGGYWTMVLARR